MDHLPEILTFEQALEFLSGFTEWSIRNMIRRNQSRSCRTKVDFAVKNTITTKTPAIMLRTFGVRSMRRILETSVSFRSVACNSHIRYVIVFGTCTRRRKVTLGRKYNSAGCKVLWLGVGTGAASDIGFES